jgi:hypothetical protein
MRERRATEPENLLGSRNGPVGSGELSMSFGEIVNCVAAVRKVLVD